MNTLQRIFQDTLSIYDYYTKIQKVPNILDEKDPPIYKKLLEEVYILKEDGEPTRFPLPTSEKLPIREVINRIIVQFVRSSTGNLKDQNCLCLGYRSRAVSSEATLKNYHDVECSFVNTIQPLVQTQAWQILLNKIGEGNLRLLLERPIFMKTVNGSFFQLSGIPCGELLSAHGSSSFINGNAQNKRSVNDVKEKDGQITGSSLLPRYKMFYNIRVFENYGFPKGHPLFKEGKNFNLADMWIFHSLNVIGETEVKPLLDTFITHLNKQYQTFNFEACFQKVVLGNKQQDLPLRKKRNRGCRAGKSNAEKKKRKVEKLSISENLPTMDTKNGKPEEEITVIPVGDMFANKLLKTVAKTISMDNKFQSQEEYSDFALGKSVPNSDEIRSSAKKIRSKIRRRLLKKKRKQLFSSQQSQDVGPSIDLQPTESNQECPDSGIYHHLKRKFHTSLNSETNPVSNPPDDVQVSDLSIESKRVAEYVKSICKHFLSIEVFWGNRHNLNKFLARVDNYINVGRHETFNMEQIMNGIQILEMPIIRSLRKSVIDRMKLAIETKNQELEISNAISQKSNLDIRLLDVDCGGIAYSLVYWIFVNIINFIVSNSFYATEIEGKGSQVFYFTKSTWNTIVRKNMLAFQNYFMPILITDEFLQEQEIEMKNIMKTTLEPNRNIVRSVSDVQNGDNSSFQLKRARSDPLPRSNLDPPVTGASSTNVPKRILPAESSLLFNDWIRKNPAQSNDVNATLNSLLLNTLPEPIRNGELPVSSLAVPAPGARSIKKKKETSTKLKNFLFQIPTVRFVPKKSTIRPITNLRSKANNKKNNSSSSFEILTNRNLYNCFHVLKGIYDQKINYFKGFSVFGLDEIYQKLSSYKATLFHKYRKNPPQQFYIMTLDLEKCYDNINTALLYDIMKYLLSHGSSLSNSSEGKGNDNNKFPYERYFPLDKYYYFHENQDALILKQIFPEDESLIHRYTVLYTINSMKRIIIKPIKHVSFNNEILSFKEMGKEIAENYPNSIIQDNVIFSKIHRKEMLKLLKAHLFSHIIRLPAHHCFLTSSRTNQKKNNPSLNEKPTTTTSSSSSNNNNFSSNNLSSHIDYNVQTQYFTQVKGIPQGSILSPLLCNFYYGFLEKIFFHLEDSSTDHHQKNKTKKKTNSNDQEELDLYGIRSHDTLVTRLMDDYLIISTDLTYMKNIYHIIKQEFSAFGGVINEKKIQSNFSLDLLSSNSLVNPENPFTSSTSSSSLMENKSILNYCGLKIHGQSLFLSPQFDKLFASSSSSPSSSSSKPYSLWNTININYQQITFGLQKSMKQFFRIKCHSIFLDYQMNSHPFYSLQDSKRFILKNIYSLFLFTSIRSFAYFTKLQKYYFHSLIHENYFFHCIKELIVFAFSLIQIRTNHKISRRLLKDPSNPVAIDQEDTDDDDDDEDEVDGDDDEEGLMDIEADDSHPVSSESRRNRLSYKVKNIKYFGSCPVTKEEIYCLGWKAFKEISQHYPHRFHPHPKGKKKSSISLNNPSTRKNNTKSRLAIRIENKYRHHLKLFSRHHFGDELLSTAADDSNRKIIHEILENNEDLIFHQLLPKELSKECEEYFNQFL